MHDQADRLSVMQVILTLERAGAQEVVRTLAEHLQEDGCSVAVCAFEDGAMRAEIEKLGIPVEVLRRPRTSVARLPSFLAEMLRIRRELAALIDKWQVDLVQTHLLQVLDFLVLSLRPTTRLRLVVWTMHNVEFLPEQMPRESQALHKLKGSGYRLLYQWLSKYVDGFVAVSDEVRREIIRQICVKPDKIHTICNAVDARPFRRPGNRQALCDELGIEIDSQLIATVGRLTEQKGQRFLVDAMNPVLSLFPNAHLLLLGKGELLRSLKQQAERNGIADRIHFLGVREDVPGLLAVVDVFVLPSLWEGLSVALLEAMAAAKPIIATMVSGTTEAMIPGETGLLVPPGDSQALAASLAQLLSDPGQAQRMGQAARQHVEKHFGAEKQAREHLALYRGLLNMENSL